MYDNMVIHGNTIDIILQYRNNNNIHITVTMITTMNQKNK